MFIFLILKLIVFKKYLLSHIIDLNVTMNVIIIIIISSSSSSSIFSSSSSSSSIVIIIIIYVIKMP
jgi:hypothetical protein